MTSSRTLLATLLLLAVSTGVASAGRPGRSGPGKRAARATVQLGTFSGLQRATTLGRETTTRKTVRVDRRGDRLIATMTSHDALGAGKDLTSTLIGTIVEEKAAPNGDTVREIRFAGQRFSRTLAADSETVRAARGGDDTLRIVRGVSDATMTFRRDGSLGIDTRDTIRVRIDALGLAHTVDSTTQAELQPIGR
jgi:hypothetical protein